MGLYRIKLSPNSTQRIPGVLEAFGMPIIRTEEKEWTTHYYYFESPNNECAFWITKEDAGEFWCSGLSSSSAKIAKAFEQADLFGTH